MSINGKTAVVTGAGSGIGKGIALRLAREGANIVVVGLFSDKLEQVAKEVEACGVKAIHVEVDISQKSQVTNLIQKTVDQFASIDILINNAGIMIRKNCAEYTEDDWDRMFAVNSKGAFLCCQEVVPIMKKQQYGKIVNVVSGAGILGMGRGAYGPSKAALISFTNTLASEVARHGINVNAVCPGATDTEMLAAVKASPEAEKTLLSTIPIGRLAQVADIAEPVLFLCSKGSDYMVGSVLMVCGGQMTTFTRY